MTHIHCSSFPNPLDPARLLPSVAIDGSYPIRVCGLDDACDRVPLVHVGNRAKQTVLPSASACDPNCDKRIGVECERVRDPEVPAPLSAVEWRDASYSWRNMGRRVGRQAQMMPTDCSMEDHMAVSMVLYIGLLALEKSKAIIRRMETMHTLHLLVWS